LQEAIDEGKTVRSDNLINGVPGTGTLLAATTSYINSASTRVRGGDLDARYTLRLSDFGAVRFDLQWTRITSYLRTEADGKQLQFAGTHGNCDTTNCVGTPKDRINFGATWDRGSYNLSTVVNFIDSFKNVDVASQTSCNSHFADGSNSPNADCRIPSFYSVDLSGAWQPTAALQVFGTVENVLDRKAPLDQRTYGAVNYNPMHWAGAIGRYYTLGMKYSFD
jgi:iron complex outermembrane receptor protein